MRTFFDYCALALALPLLAAGCSSGNYSIGREGQNGQALQPGSSCQGVDGGSVCVTGAYCKFADGTCGAQGTCTAEPMACTEEYAPVCGCDGKTYGNACSANGAGQSILGTGICTGNPCTVDSFGEPGCVAGSFCQLAQGTCNPKNGPAVQGACAAKPETCTQEYAPVCGCDAKTYGNACEAAAAGISVTATGTCP